MNITQIASPENTVHLLMSRDEYQKLGRITSKIPASCLAARKRIEAALERCNWNGTKSMAFNDLSMNDAKTLLAMNGLVELYLPEMTDKNWAMLLEGI